MRTNLYILGILVLLIFSACNVVPSDLPLPQSSVDAPLLSPAGDSELSAPVTVTMSSRTQGATIVYAVNEQLPDYNEWLPVIQDLNVLGNQACYDIMYDLSNAVQQDTTEWQALVQAGLADPNNDPARFGICSAVLLNIQTLAENQESYDPLLDYINALTEAQIDACMYVYEVLQEDIDADIGGWYTLIDNIPESQITECRVAFEGLENTQVYADLLEMVYKDPIVLTQSSTITAVAFSPTEIFPSNPTVETYTIGDTPINLNPIVNITSPLQGATFNPGEQIIILADASDPDGTVANVEFFADGTSIKVDSQGPSYTTSWTPSTKGTHEIRAVATDNQGATASKTIGIEIEQPVNQYPSLTITSPQNNAVVAPKDTVTISATASDPDGSIASVEFFINDESIELITSDTQYTTTWEAEGAGTYEVKVTATDNQGADTSLTRTVIVQEATNQNPTVNIVAPLNNAVIQLKEQVLIEATASDPDGSIESVEFFVDDVSIKDDTSGPQYTASWDAETAGEHQIKAVATDNLGVPATKSITITVEEPKTPPTVSITAPTDSQEFNEGETVNIVANAQDDDGNLAGVKFFVDNNEIGTDTTGPTYSFGWTSSGVDTHTLKVQAYDTDNLIATDSVDIIIKAVVVNQPPAVEITSPTNGEEFTSPASFEVQTTATDPEEGEPASVSFYINGDLESTITTSPFNYKVNELTTGSYDIVARATDSLGLYTDSETVSVLVIAPNGNYPPNVTFISPEDDGLFTEGEPLTFEIVAEDQEVAGADRPGGISYIELYRNSTSTPIVNTTNASINYTWSAPILGDYIFTANAYDNEGAVDSESITVHIVNIVVDPDEFCGDNICNNGETKYTCSADCGSPSSGGGGGGGGGGRRSTPPPPVPDDEELYIPTFREPTEVQGASQASENEYAQSANNENSNPEIQTTGDGEKVGLFSSIASWVYILVIIIVVAAIILIVVKNKKFQATMHRHKNPGIPAESLKQCETFVGQMKTLGNPNGVIRQKLSDAGWPDEHLDYLMNKFAK